MKTIGLIGGMSWESTVSYYQLLNRGINQKLGGLHSAKLILNSVNFAEIEQLQHEGDWQQTAVILKKAAQSLQAAGADFIMICTNTMHLVADEVAASVDIPLLHIVNAVGQTLQSHKVEKTALLGTIFTMQKPFYKEKLQNEYGIEVLTPNKEQQSLIHNVIYQELCKGQINPNSKAAYVKIVEDLASQGAQGAILGCTEIGLLLQPNDTCIPIFDTTKIHAQAAVECALS